MAELFNAYAQGVQLGQQQRQQREQRNQLAELQSLAPQVIAGDRAATDRAYALNPQTAKAYQGQQDRNRNMVYNAARYLKGALDRNNPAEIAGAWRTVRPGLINAGIATEQDLSPDWQPEYAQTVHQALAMGDGGANQTPTDVRSFQMMTQGLSADDTERARRINLGLDGRASTSGFSQVKFTGADGRERLGVLNGRTGQIDLPDGTSFNPQTGAISQTAGMQQGAAQPAAQATVFRAPNGEVIDVSQVTEPGLREAIMQSPEQWGLVPDGGSAHLPPRNVSPAQAGAGTFVGRAPEEQAAANEAAKLGVQQQFLPQELNMRTDAAIRQAGGSAQAKGEAEARLEAVQNLPRVMQESNNAVSLINQALNHPGLATAVGASGRADPRNYLPGTDATDFRVLLDQIKGGTFLQAFQSLKGGGAITEVEGTKAEQAIARLNRDQSEEAFRQSLMDLRDVAQNAMTRAQMKAEAAGGPARPSGGAPRQIQSAAEYNALPSGSLFIAPDGTQRRKR